jgi:hypothetical protein
MNLLKKLLKHNDNTFQFLRLDNTCLRLNEDSGFFSTTMFFMFLDLREITKLIRVNNVVT